jgi:hypothetical protein
MTGVTEHNQCSSLNTVALNHLISAQQTFLNLFFYARMRNPLQQTRWNNLITAERTVLSEVTTIMPTFTLQRR